jgi:hypothetical protein
MAVSAVQLQATNNATAVEPGLILDLRHPPISADEPAGKLAWGMYVQRLRPAIGGMAGRARRNGRAGVAACVGEIFADV